MTLIPVLWSHLGAEGNSGEVLPAGQGAQEVQRSFHHLQAERRPPGHAENQRHQPSPGRVRQSGGTDPGLRRSAGSKHGHSKWWPAEQSHSPCWEWPSDASCPVCFCRHQNGTSTFVYADSSPLQGFTSWGPEGPPTSNSSCVELLSTGAWAHVECEATMFFICEFPKSRRRGGGRRTPASSWVKKTLGDKCIV